MNRDAMARLLYSAWCVQKAYTQKKFHDLRQSDRIGWLDAADAAIAECANAAEEAYREGAAHGHAYSSDWMHSATRAKWGK